MKRISSILLSLALCSLCCYSVFGLNLSYTDANGNTVKASDFRDTQGHWAHDAILKWGDYGIVNGYDANFMPNYPIKRGDFCIIVDNLLGLKTTTYNFYNDLPNSSYYREAVLRCVAAGYITGTGTNSVSPESYTTREQAAVILCRIFNIDTPNTTYTGFVDDAQVSSWAKPAIYAMKRMGYMTGNEKGQCMPQSSISRAEMITLLNNICNTYIPKRDNSNQGTTFTGNYPINLVTSRNIELNNASVGRDLILTQATSTLSMTNSKVNGRILVLGKNNLNLKNTYVSQIVLMEGKSIISGINEGVESVYIAKDASESTLDVIPEKMILESGVRVSVAGVMYENRTNKDKTYYGIDLKQDIAEEQGYVVGGPKVTSANFHQDEDNRISVTNVKITAGDSDIKEVGVIWLEQDRRKDIINPTYNNSDGRALYRSNKYNEAFSFEVNEVEGLMAYRLYVKDKDGLFAYSNTYVFEEYEYSVSMKLVNDDGSYPNKITVEVYLTGSNIPEVSNVNLIWDITEDYTTSHNQTSMSLRSNTDREKIYSTTITSPTVEKESVPPTAFGYAIKFKDATSRSRFPVLTNALPRGVAPISDLQTGMASYTGGTSLTIKDNKVMTHYIKPSEVGVAYLTSNLESVPTPAENISGWTRKAASKSVDILDTLYYDVEIPMLSNTGYTYYCAYVKADTGYWYSTVQKVDNNVQGDEGGPRIQQNPIVMVLNETSAVITFNVYELSSDVNTVDKFVVFSSKDGVSDTSLANKSLSDFDYEILNGAESGERNITVLLKNLTPNTSYNLGFQIKNSDNLKSNIMSVAFNTSNPMKVNLSDKFLNSYSWVEYTVEFENDKCYLKDEGHSISEETARIKGSYSGGRSSISVVDVNEYNSTQVTLSCIYSPFGNSKGFEFSRTLDLY